MSSQPLNSPLLLSMGIRDRATLDRLQFKTPALLALGLAPLKQARIEAAKAQQARAARVGRDLGVVDRCDFGHAVRLNPVRTRDGTVLREADVKVVDEADETDASNHRRTIRRARRADPLQTLWKYKSITTEQFDAGERLRANAEAATPSPGGWAQSDVHVAPWARVGVTSRQIEACGAVRAALRAITGTDRLAITWIVLGGGTVRGAALYARICDKTVTSQLRSGLDALVSFYAEDPHP
jgi:hypothetical protein